LAGKSSTEQMQDHTSHQVGQAVEGPVLVSVVIPAYNAAPYIAATLGSVFAQTFKSREVIVVNGGSPDTPALELALEPFPAKIRYIQQENRGASAARNAAIRAGREKYLAFLDSDDLCLPKLPAQQVARAGLCECPVP
jgi:glycosyltransferase involved in cell wall biosynthesis